MEKMVRNWTRTYFGKEQNKSMAFEVEGTNSAGDLGAAASVSFSTVMYSKVPKLL